MVEADIKAWARLCSETGLSGADLRQYYTLEGQSSPPDHAVALARCLTDPELLMGHLDQAIPGISHRKQLRIQASVLQQELALQVIAPLTVRLFLDGGTPLPTGEQIVFVPQEDSQQWSWLEDGTCGTADEFIAHMSHHLTQWYPAFRKAYGVSPGAYWSSVGLGLGAPFSALYNIAPPDELCTQATHWLSRFNCDAARFIDWIPAVFDSQPMAIPQRRGCCLKYLLPEGGYCGTCGVYRKERMARAPNTPKGSSATAHWLPEQ